MSVSERDRADIAETIGALVERIRSRQRDEWTVLKCSDCGAQVSSQVPANTVVRAWIQCPECLEEMR